MTHVLAIDQGTSGTKAIVGASSPALLEGIAAQVACLAELVARNLGADEVVGTWTPQHVYEPRWTDDRAADHLARWRRAAAAVLVRDSAQS